jgi:hypothetical protein
VWKETQVFSNILSSSSFFIWWIYFSFPIHNAVYLSEVTRAPQEKP